MARSYKPGFRSVTAMFNDAVKACLEHPFSLCTFMHSWTAYRVSPEFFSMSVGLLIFWNLTGSGAVPFVWYYLSCILLIAVASYTISAARCMSMLSVLLPSYHQQTKRGLCWQHRLMANFSCFLSIQPTINSTQARVAQHGERLVFSPAVDVQ